MKFKNLMLYIGEYAKKQDKWQFEYTNYEMVE